ncbi:MAG: cupin domain-containing protein [Actinoallomurus sp.]
MKIISGRVAGAASEQRSSTFTGTVWADPVLPVTDGTTINNVFFTPGARTHWHRHEAGQVLHVTAGGGFVCAQGGDPQRLSAGDTVWIAPGEKHWHGAAPDSYLIHLAISLGTTAWHEPVDDDEYPTGDPS